MRQQVVKAEAEEVSKTELKAGAPMRPKAAQDVESRGRATVEPKAAPPVEAERKAAGQVMWWRRPNQGHWKLEDARQPWRRRAAIMVMAEPDAASETRPVRVRSDKTSHVDRCPWQSRGRARSNAWADMRHAADGGAGPAALQARRAR